MNTSLNSTSPLLSAIDSDIAAFSFERSFELRNGLVLSARHWKSGPANVETRDCRRFIAFHGFLDNAGSFDLLAPLLLKQLGPEPVEIVALDLAGHGLSDHRTTEDYALWRYVDDADQVVEQLGWQRHAIIGHSMGGAASTIYAGLYDSRVTLCVLLDNFGPITRDVDDQPQHLLEHITQKRGLPKKRLPFHPSIESACKARSQGGISEEYARVLMPRGLRPAERTLDDGAVVKGWTWTTDRLLTIRSAQSLSEDYAKAFMSRISCPVLAVLAEEGLLTMTAGGNLDEWKNYRLGWMKTKTTIKGVPGCHSVHMENAPLVAEKDRPISPRYSDCVGFLPWKVPEETKTWQGNFVSWSCGIVWFISEFTLDLALIALGKSIEDGSTIRGSASAKGKDSYLYGQQRGDFSHIKPETMDDDAEALFFEDSESIYDEYSENYDDDSENIYDEYSENVYDDYDEEDMAITIEEGEKILAACETVEEDVAVEMTPYTEEEDVIVDMTATAEEEIIEEGPIVNVMEGVAVEIMKDDAEMAVTVKEESVIANEDGRQSIGALSEQPSVLVGNRNSDHCSDLTFVIVGEQSEAVPHSKTESGSKHDLKIIPEKVAEEEEECQVKSTVYSSSDNYTSDSEEVESEESTDESEGCTCHDDSCSKDIATMTPGQSDSISETKIETPIFRTWSERKAFSKGEEPIIDDLAAFASLLRQNMPRHNVDPTTSPDDVDPIPSSDYVDEITFPDMSRSFVGPITSLGIAAKIYQETIDYSDYNGYHSSESPVAESNSSIDPINESDFPATESNLPVAKSNSPAESDLPVEELNSPVAESSLPVAESNFPVAESSFPVAESSFPVAESNFPVVESSDSNASTTPEITTITAAATDIDTTATATVTTTTTQKKKKKKNKKKNQAKRQEQSQESDANETDEIEDQGPDANIPMSMSSKEANQKLKKLMEISSSDLDTSLMSTIAACSLDGKFTELGSVAALTRENGDLEKLYLDALSRTPWERKPSREPAAAK
ncbi:hypothetical protein BGZ79_008559 [Entomortierella chlamydospora]|nr:hypothetical protein BGZ79_008559 [Entomortierella chlamydospora]